LLWWQASSVRVGRPARRPASCSAFTGFQFPPDVIVLAVRWYLRFGLSYRDVEELLAEGETMGIYQPQHPVAIAR
jgi:hypothetical protein